MATLAFESACTAAFGVTNLVRAAAPTEVSDIAYRVETRLHPIASGIGPINAVGTDMDLSPSGPRCCSGFLLVGRMDPPYPDVKPWGWEAFGRIGMVNDTSANVPADRTRRAHVAGGFELGFSYRLTGDTKGASEYPLVSLVLAPELACTWTTRGPVPAGDRTPQSVPWWEPQVSVSLVLRGQFSLSALP